MTLKKLKVKLYADGADKAGMLGLYQNNLIQGLTTNPTLMKKSFVADYERFAREVLDVIRDKPVSFEVLSDDFAEMRVQALRIAGWQSNVYVKIPVTNSRGESSVPLIRGLAQDGVQINVTAVMTSRQVNQVAEALHPDVASVVSVFAGRIADTGRDPMSVMRASRAFLNALPKAELLWASVREVLNIFQANRCGCHIVTVPHDILAKALQMCGMDLDELSLATVRMFARDAQSAGYTLGWRPLMAARAQAGAGGLHLADRAE